MLHVEINKVRVTLHLGNITKLKVDAIVNAANSGLRGGGGVDGAIHKAGGPRIMEECKTIIEDIKTLQTGEAVITTAGNLPASKVIHTVGPVWHGEENNKDKLLSNAYLNSLKLGAENDVTSIAFPSISTGIYRYPIDRASRIAFETVVEYLKTNKHNYREVYFVLFSKTDFDVYERLFKEFSRGVAQSG